MIVVGIDGSEASRETLRFAVDEARRWHTELHVVHAYWEWDPVPGSGEVELERSPEQREAWLAALVREIVGEVADVEISSFTVEDDPAPALVAAARDADLLIVGLRGHGGLGDRLLGSVSEHCSHHASCSVVIVR